MTVRSPQKLLASCSLRVHSQRLELAQSLSNQETKATAYEVVVFIVWYPILSIRLPTEWLLSVLSFRTVFSNALIFRRISRRVDTSSFLEKRKAGLRQYVEHEAVKRKQFLEFNYRLRFKELSKKKVLGYQERMIRVSTDNPPHVTQVNSRPKYTTITHVHRQPVSCYISSQDEGQVCVIATSQVNSSTTAH